MDAFPLELLQSATTIAVAHDGASRTQSEMRHALRQIAALANADVEFEHCATHAVERLQFCTAVNEWQCDANLNNRQIRKAFIVDGSRFASRLRHDAFNQFDSALEKLLYRGRHHNTVTIVDADVLRLPFRYHMTMLLVFLPHRNLETVFRVWLRPFFVDFAAFEALLRTNASSPSCIAFDLSLRTGSHRPFRFEHNLFERVVSESGEAEWKSFTDEQLFSKEEGEEVTTENCSICLDEYKNEDRLRKLGCGHRFHKGCLDACVAIQLYCCPLCQQPICTAVDRHGEAK